MGKYIRRMCLATDIQRYTDRTNPEQEDAQRRLVNMIGYVCRRAGLTGVDRQPSGDGQILVLRPGLDEARVVPTLVLGLRHALHENNRDPGPFGRIRLRAAICQGAVADSRNGWVGQAVVAAARLINSAKVRAGLDNPGRVDLALAVPDDLYEDIVRQNHPGLPPGAFRQIYVEEKNYSATAWLHSPESGPTADPYARRARWLPIGAALAVGAIGGVAIGSGGTPGHPPAGPSHPAPSPTASHHPGGVTAGHPTPLRVAAAGPHGGLTAAVPAAPGWGRTHPAGASGRPDDDPDDGTDGPDPDADDFNDSVDDAMDGIDGIF